MAEIASQARMSMGQIYRYFPNKEAIVHAIVERIVARRLAWIEDSTKTYDMPVMLATRAFDEDLAHADDRILLMEVTAEATRNPTVAQIVKAADQRLFEVAVASVRSEHPSLSPKEAAARVEVMAVLSEGTAFRNATVQIADPKVLAKLYKGIIDMMFPPSQAKKPARKRAA